MRSSASFSYMRTRRWVTMLLACTFRFDYALNGGRRKFACVTPRRQLSDMYRSAFAFGHAMHTWVCSAYAYAQQHKRLLLVSSMAATLTEHTVVSRHQQCCAFITPSRWHEDPPNTHSLHHPFTTSSLVLFERLWHGYAGFHACITRRI